MQVTSSTSDGYHTFDELYDHRITLWIALCKEHPKRSWRSTLHHDRTSFDGWFVLGMDRGEGEQKTYHLPIGRWPETDFAQELPRAPKFDGHTSADVLDRIKRI